MSTDTLTSPHPQSSRVSKPEKIGAESCMKCGGAGGYRFWPGFTCWRCSGNGIDPTYRSWVMPASWTVEQCIEWDEKRLARNAAATERRHAREQAKRESGLAAFLAEQTPEDAAGLQAIINLPFEEQHGIANDITRKLKQYGSISQAQVDLALKVQAEMTEKLEAAANAPELPELVEGRRHIEGLVISTKSKESAYGTQYKMLVQEDDGNRVYGTIPAAIDGVVWGTNRTVRVSFDAAVKVSGDDEHFGWYQRPTKAEATPVEEAQ